ncbi:unnamed protein product [Ilex paraguariensis]|uniref:DUF1639 family protein n=1 Tax=Ilex paraguariensis TaxID=185542 RepID=A0ABC8SXR5_9AQUA
MVISGESEEGKKESMAMGPERSKLLHNFTLPSNLKWGSRRFLRCMKVDSNGENSVIDRRFSLSQVENGFIRRQGESETERFGSVNRMGSFVVSRSVVPEVRRSGCEFSGGEDGIEVVRAKLMSDLRNEAGKMKDAILRENFVKKPPVAVIPAVAEPLKPWNLRKRRAACKDPNGGDGVSGGKISMVDVVRPNFASPARNDSKSPRLRGNDVGGGGGCDDGAVGEMKKRAKFSVPLSKREIAEDFMAMVGHRPPRRPKRRPRIVQRDLDTVFPGLWLTEISPNLYSVPDAAETGKVG